jgi:hypothetical protein
MRSVMGLGRKGAALLINEFSQAAGGVEKVDVQDDGNVLVSFKSRGAAEAVSHCCGRSFPSLFISKPGPLEG